jgi:hypothetical protein
MADSDATTPTMALLKQEGREIPIPEAVARDDAQLEEFYPGTTTDPTKGIFRETVGGQMIVHVYTEAVIQVEGQTIPVAPAIARDDQKVRDSLVLLFGSGTHLEISRTMVGERLIVSIVKRAGPKGTSQAVLRALAAAPEEWNPALLLEWELTALDAADRLDIMHLIGMQEHIESAIEQGERWQTQVTAAMRVLGNAHAVPAGVIPAGF